MRKAFSRPKEFSKSQINLLPTFNTQRSTYQKKIQRTLEHQYVAIQKGFTHFLISERTSNFGIATVSLGHILSFYKVDSMN